MLFWCRSPSTCIKLFPHNFSTKDQKLRFSFSSIITIYFRNSLALNYCLYWTNVMLSWSYNVMILYTMYWTLDVLIIFLCSPDVQYISNRLKLSQIPHSPDSNRWLNNFNASSSSSSFRENPFKFLSTTLRKRIFLHFKKNFFIFNW